MKIISTNRFVDVFTKDGWKHHTRFAIIKTRGIPKLFLKKLSGITLSNAEMHHVNVMMERK